MEASFIILLIVVSFLDQILIDIIYIFLRIIEQTLKK